MKARRQLPTQTDVAEAAGVSTATVSRVINNQGAITPSARQRVQEAIERLNYVPHAGARALAMQRTHTLGAIIPTLNNAIFAEGINAFERTAQSLGYTLLLSVSQQDLQHELALVIKMIERGVDGLLLVGNMHEEAVFDRLEQAEVSHVCTWAYDPAARAANIGFDNAQSMHAVVDHLVTLGHHNVGMLAGQVQHNDRARDRVVGVRSRLNHHGLSLSEANIIELEYAIEPSRVALRQLLNRGVTAVVCGNDVIAYGALLEAQTLGRRVPEDLSITGFDDLSLSAQLNPALTSVQVNAVAMGKAAARQLTDAVEGRADMASVQMPTQLVVRQTTGPCKR